MPTLDGKCACGWRVPEMVLLFEMPDAEMAAEAVKSARLKIMMICPICAKRYSRDESLSRLVAAAQQKLSS